MSKIIHEFKNAETAMTSYITESENGMVHFPFGVHLKDEDSGNIVPCSKHFSDEEVAISYAKKIADVK